VSAERATREHFGRGYKVPNGGIYSVQILSQESRAEISTAQTPAEGYGLGFFVREQDGVTIVGHGGSVAGYNADLQFDLDSKIGVAVLRTTSYRPPTGDLLQRLIAVRTVER
jgi:CubicO group peptidase (beta-lactamase class C family)